MAIARRTRVFCAPRPAGTDHRDAVDRAGRDAQRAARAHRGEDRVHPLRCSDDRVDGAGVDAKCAADAGRLVDPRDGQRTRVAARAIQRNRRTAGERCKLCDDDVVARRAAIDRRATGDRFGIGTAALIAAAPALRLRKDGVDAIGKGCRCRGAHPPHFTEPPNRPHVPRAQRLRRGRVCRGLMVRRAPTSDPASRRSGRDLPRTYDEACVRRRPRPPRLCRHVVTSDSARRGLDNHRATSRSFAVAGTAVDNGLRLSP